jgi:hypothetical protein
VAGCGGGKKAPEVVTFDGPSSISCTGGGTKTVHFQYETKNAEAVEPEIDGQPVGASAGYDPDSGTMNFPYLCPGPHTLAISATGNNQTVTTPQKVTSTGGSASGKPEIVTFDGPSSISCSGGGTKVVNFDYATKNAIAVEPEVDGENPGAQAGYPPDSGTMGFPYICPGPHTVTIVASNKDGESVSKSVTVKSTGGNASAAPQILEFNGPDVASCGTPSGDTVTLSYSYRTKNATAVEPSIDGVPVGASAGYDPVHGVMRFPYVCPGPHTLTITASGHGSTSQSIDVAPSSAG